MKTTLISLFLLVSTASCHSTSTESPTLEIMQEKDLLKATQKNDIYSVKMALEKGANVNTIDENKRSLLLTATINQNKEMVELLLKYNANVNQQATNLDSPFLLAGATGQEELLKLFLNNGARFDVFNRYYGSALIPACERGHVETVRLLSNTKGFPVDHINRLSWTGLMEAVILGDGSKKYQEIVQILKDAGAKMDIPDHDGITPLQHAERREFKEIAAIIRN